MKKLKKLTFCPPARQADAHRIIVNKTKDELDSSIKITSPHRNDRDRSLDVRRSHLPLKLEPVEAGGSWRSWCRCFYYFWHVVMCELCFSWEEERDFVVLEAVGLWACNVQISAKDLVLKKGLRFAVGFWELFWVGCLIFHPILRVTYEGTDIFLIKFTGKPWKYKKSVNTKVTQNLISLVVNNMSAHDH